MWRTVLCALLDSVTTRASSRPSMCASSWFVRAKCPRWLVPRCSSNPSSVRRRGAAITPALLMRRSSPSWARVKPSANVRTDDRRARSSGTSSGVGPDAVAFTSASAVLPFSMFRQASTTSAPLRASSRAVTSPSPLFAPVTTAMRPLWSGIRSASQRSAMARTLVDRDARARPDEEDRAVLAALAAHADDEPPAALADVLVLRDPPEREAPVVADVPLGDRHRVLSAPHRRADRARAELDYGPAAAPHGLDVGALDGLGAGGDGLGGVGQR